MITEAKEGNFKRMDVMHHLLAGYKAVFSERNLLGIEVARKACGGAGYSSNSGIPVLFFNNSPIPTYEGDNTVMMLQASRYLKKLKSKNDSLAAGGHYSCLRGMQEGRQKTQK